MIYLKEGVTPLNFAYNDEIIQEGNSKYQLSFKFPTNNPLWEELVEETLLLADDLHGEQEFIIFEVEKHHGYITVYANQVATLLNNYSITELSVNNASGDRVMRSLVSSIIREHRFTFSSDIANTHSLNLKNVTVATALFKDKHSILGQWGGDLIRDKYDIRLLSNGGTNKEALFMYKKNLKSYQQKKSIKDLRTRIHFTKTINSQKEGEKDKVIAVTVDSPLIGKYKNIYEGNLDVSDQDVVDEATLRKYGENYFKTTLCDVIEESIEINVVGIPDEPVGIFDTVTIFHEKFNLDVKKKITKYTYSPMGCKLKTIGFGKIQSNLGTTLATMVDNAIEEKAETMLDAFKIQKNLSELLKLDRKGIEDKLVELEEKSKGALEVKKALFEADGTIPEVVKTKILDAVEGDIGRLKTIITEAELIKAIQAKLNFAEIKNALIDKAFINQIISDEKFTQQFEEGQVTTQNIFTKLKDSIKSNISKEFVTKDGVRKLVNDLTIDADGIRQITQQESQKVFNTSITGKVQEIVGEVKKNLPTKEELKGKSSYLHKKYSDYPDGRNMSDNSTLKYIGIYTGDKQQAPTNASEYSWTKIRGEDGERGRDGNNGVSNYIHRKYSDYSNGANMSDNSNLKYIGIYTGTSSTPPTTASSYLWSKIKGEDGANGTPGVKGADGRTPYFHTAYSNSPTGDRDFSTTNSTGKQYIGTYSDFEVADSTDYRKYKWMKIKGEDGQDGKSYARNYLSGTADEKVLLAINDDHDVQEAFKLLDNKNFRDLGFKNGDKVTFIADYEVLPNGSNKKINKLNFEWHDDNQYRVWMEQDINPTKGTYVRTLTMDNNLLDCKQAKFRADNVNAKIKITNARVIQGDTVQPWSIAQEDLQGHTLTANLRFEGRYINSVTTNVKPYLDVYYDGQKVDSGFNAQVKYKGGNSYDWSGFWNAEVDSNGGITNVDWGNREQNGTPLELIVLVTYKGLNTIANARMENVPDIVEIKEITKKYKTFESTIDRFDSTIGEVKKQVLANEEKRNLIIGSRLLNDSDYKVFGKAITAEDLQGVTAKIYQNTNGVVGQLYNGNPYLYVIAMNNTQPSWQGVGFKLSTNYMQYGSKYSLRIPFLIIREATLDKGIYMEIKNHNTGNVIWNYRLDKQTFPSGEVDTHKGIWIERTATFQLERAEVLSDYSFWVYAVQNGGFCISAPYMCEGDVLPKTYSPAPEDVHLQNSRIESSIKQTKDEIDLKVSKDNVIASINASVETTGEGPAQGVVKINADKVDISGVLRAYTGEIGGFRIGYNYNDGGFWLTGKNNFDCGINPGLNEGSNGAQLWAAWGRTWTQAGPNAWWVTAQGIMVCKNTPTFHKGMEVYGRYIDTHGNDIQGNQSGGGKTTVIWWSQINSVKSQISDERLKNNIKPTKVNALDLLNNIEMVEFNWKKDGKFEKIGAIAQQVQSVDKDLVVHDMDDKQTYNDYLRINYYDTIPYLIKAVQELSEENTNLKSQLKAMNERLTKLEDKINGKL